MGKTLLKIPLMTSGEVSTDDRMVIEDVSKPKTKAITIAEFIKVILAPLTITRAMIKVADFTGTTDANGWTLSYDVRGKKIYRKKGVTGNVTWGGGSWFWVTASSLPVGIANLTNYYVDGTATTGDAAITVAIQPAATATSINLTTTNQYGATVVQSITYSITLTEI